MKLSKARLDFEQDFNSNVFTVFTKDGAYSVQWEPVKEKWWSSKKIKGIAFDSKKELLKWLAKHLA